MPYSYFLSDESPGAYEILWATLAIGNDQRAKLVMVIESETGIEIMFDKEIDQSRIADLLWETITTKDIYTQ